MQIPFSFIVVTLQLYMFAVSYTQFLNYIYMIYIYIYTQVHMADKDKPFNQSNRLSLLS